MKQLNDSQIEELYVFTRQHYVEWYDVQTELVDHLANDIEATWENRPGLTFEKARDASFKKFGVFGFMEVVEKKAAQMNKKYWRIVWVVFKEFFKIPQVIITATICIVLFTLLTSFYQKWVYLSVVIIGVVVMIFQAIRLKKKMKFKKTQKKWLLEENIYNLGGAINGINIFIQIVFRFSDISSNILLLLISFLLTSLILVVYITVFVLPKETSKILEKEYPEQYSVTFV